LAVFVIGAELQAVVGDCEEDHVVVDPVGRFEVGRGGGEVFEAATKAAASEVNHSIIIDFVVLDGE
jgi:hypothetical protein